MIFIKCFTFRASLIYVNSHLRSRHYYDASPIYIWNKSIEAFNQGISEYAFNSYLVRKETLEKSKTKLNVVKVVLDVEESLEVIERDDNDPTHPRLK